MTILQANVDAAVRFFAARVGTAYDYGGMWSPTNPRTVGTDCSGMVDTILHILTSGSGGGTNSAGRFIRTISTESWPYNYTSDLAVAVGTHGPFGTICAGDAQPGGGAVYPPRIPSDAAAIIYLMHGGGGEGSHVMIAVGPDRIIMETGGAHNDTGGTGRYASPNGPATSTTSSEWTDIWYLPGPVVPGVLPPPAPAFTYPSDHDMLVQVWEQLLGPHAKGWPQLGGHTLVDAVAELLKGKP